HASSFLLSFSHRIVESHAFRDFWFRYRPISTRMWTIMSGEVLLTKCLTMAGYHPNILFRADDLQTKLRALGDDELNSAVALFPTNIREKLEPISSCSSLDLESKVSKLAVAAVEAIREVNQIHAAGFLFMKFFGLPLLKRDITYRELFSVPEATQIVASIYGSVSPEIADDLAKRTPPSRLNVVRRMLYCHGYV